MLVVDLPATRFLPNLLLWALQTPGKSCFLSGNWIVYTQAITRRDYLNRRTRFEKDLMYILGRGWSHHVLSIYSRWSARADRLFTGQQRPYHNRVLHLGFCVLHLQPSINSNKEEMISNRIITHSIVCEWYDTPNQMEQSPTQCTMFLTLQYPSYTSIVNTSSGEDVHV